jgi:hypothetical protein
MSGCPASYFCGEAHAQTYISRWFESLCPMPCCCVSSKPHVSWQEPSSAWWIKLLVRYSAQCYPKRQGRLVMRASPEVLMGDNKS